MNQYELLYILPTVYTDAEVEDIRTTVLGILEKVGGSMTRTDNLGKIRFAYPINKQRHGSYILVHFNAEPGAVKELDRLLKLTDEVLRHMIVSLPESEKDVVYEISSYEPPITGEGKRRAGEKKDAPKPEAKKQVAPPPPAKTEEKNLSIEELDQKLDKILEDDVSKNI